MLAARSVMARGEAMTREPKKWRRVGTARANSPREPVMRDVNTYRRYAEECRRLADKMPEHRKALLEMAEAWLACAAAAEARANGSKRAESPNRNELA